MNRKVWKKIVRDRRSRKYSKLKKKLKKYKIQNIYKQNQTKNYNSNPNYKHHHNESIYRDAITKIYTVPTIFSIIDNPNETIKYFKIIYDDIFKKIPEAIFLIDSLEVQHVTVDALVYLIAIMENMKLVKSMKYDFEGNLPGNQAAKSVYTESGFMDYVESKVKKLPNNSKMRIVSGTMNLPSVSKAVCDFIIKELSITRQDIQFVQKILVELMSNSYYHAYPDEKVDIMFPKWYIYAEHMDNKIRIIFTDTGKGITGTIRRRFTERVFNIKDEELLQLAFQPDSFIRSETKLAHRGNGLPGIKSVIDESPIQAFWVFSGGGGLLFENKNNQKNLTKLHFEHKIYGTTVVFEF
jgi:anti-sigma regulatory factor (Ser/Thr protein kinase)